PPEAGCGDRSCVGRRPRDSRHRGCPQGEGVPAARPPGFAILRRPRRFAAGVVTWQAASWIFRLATVYAFLRAFHVPATAHNALLVLVVQSLATLFPFTPGGVGTQQGLLVYVFRGAPISKTALLTF